MGIIGLLACIAGLGTMCWLMFNLAVNALAFWIGLSAGLLAHHAGAGVMGAALAGLTAGVVSLAATRLAFTLTPSAPVRTVIALSLAIPASLAGFHAAHGLAALGSASELWRTSFAWIGAIAVGATAMVRMASGRVTPSRSGQNSAGAS